MQRLSVVGTGYLGATHAACMAHLGFEVLGVDVDADKVARLARGEPPFHEPGLAPLLREHTASGRLRFTTSIEDAAEFADVHFLCVGTPQSPHGEAADLSHLHAAVRALAPLLRNDCVVVGKSTVPAGTARELAEFLCSTAPAGEGVRLAWNPEFLREGHAVQDTLAPDRIVLGMADNVTEKVLREVYAPLLDSGVPLVCTDPTTAELTKVAANAFLALKVSYINAVAEVCEAVGADVVPLAEALGHDPRIGGHHLRPGLGFGGACLPKDLRAFAAAAAGLGLSGVPRLLREADAVNLGRRTRAAQLVRELCDGDLRGHRVAVLGGSFKPDSDDIRDSPALHVAARLRAGGADVVLHDPVAVDRIRRQEPSLRCADTLWEACRGADVVLVATEWDEYSRVDPKELDGVVARRRVVDARHALDAARWRSAGWTYRAPGRP